MSNERYDVIILGGGNAGIGATMATREAGRSVAMIESWTLGGTCPNRGCTPKKVLVAAGHSLHEIERAKVHCITVGEPHLDWAALIDRELMERALLNLVLNGRDAMPDGGRLTLGSRNEEGKVIVEISDTGVGIASENLTKIFDPFFTTKEVGRGTGLGLAVCYGIVTEHGGRLDVQSTVGVGTTFMISLPGAKVHDGDLRT